MTELRHNITSDSGDDPVVTAWQWLAGHQAFEVGQAGARRVMPHLAGQDAAWHVAGDSCGVRKTRSQPDTRTVGRAATATCEGAPSHMTCPVNVSLSGGYPDGRTRRRDQEPAEPPQVRGISVGFSASTTGTPGSTAGPVSPLRGHVFCIRVATPLRPAHYSILTGCSRVAFGDDGGNISCIHAEVDVSFTFTETGA